jgi:hypothetical protein
VLIEFDKILARAEAALREVPLRFDLKSRDRTHRKLSLWAMPAEDGFHVAVILGLLPAPLELYLAAVRR